MRQNGLRKGMIRKDPSMVRTVRDPFKTLTQLASEPFLLSQVHSGGQGKRVEG